MARTVGPVPVIVYDNWGVRPLRVIQRVEVFSVLDVDRHRPLIPARSSVPESLTIVMERCG